VLRGEKGEVSSRAGAKRCGREPRRKEGGGGGWSAFLFSFFTFDVARYVFWREVRRNWRGKQGEAAQQAVHNAISQRKTHARTHTKRFLQY